MNKNLEWKLNLFHQEFSSFCFYQGKMKKNLFEEYSCRWIEEPLFTKISIVFKEIVLKEIVRTEG